jgi:hypothetical protein
MSQYKQPSPQDLSVVILSLGALRVCPVAEWTDAFLAASLQLLPSASAQELTATAKGLARLRVRPGDEWWAAFQIAALPQLEAGGFSPQGLADVMAALAMAEAPLCEDFAAAWASQAEGRAAEMEPRALVKALWAAARLRLPAGVPLRRALVDAAEARGALRQLPQGDLVRLAWALVRLFALPTQDLSDGLTLQLCRAASGGGEPSGGGSGGSALTGRQLLRAAWALPRLRVAPRPALVSYFSELAEARAAVLWPAGSFPQGVGDVIVDDADISSGVEDGWVAEELQLAAVTWAALAALRASADAAAARERAGRGGDRSSGGGSEANVPAEAPAADRQAGGTGEGCRSLLGAAC